MRWDSLVSEVTTYGLAEGGGGRQFPAGPGIFYLCHHGPPSLLYKKDPLQPISSYCLKKCSFLPSELFQNSASRQLRNVTSSHKRSYSVAAKPPQITVEDFRTENMKSLWTCSYNHLISKYMWEQEVINCNSADNTK